MIFEIESNKYENSNLFNMAIHQLGYIITAPLKGNQIIELKSSHLQALKIIIFLGLGEAITALKTSMTRDGLSQVEPLKSWKSPVEDFQISIIK